MSKTWHMGSILVPGPAQRHLGRICPTSYRYGPQALTGAPALEVGSLWIAGGLYGNVFALEALIRNYERDSGDKALVFNGDFHWFDADPADFEAVNEAVLAFHATRGNVETELAQPSGDAGCGCGYPESVDQGTVERSNRIIQRLRLAAQSVPETLSRLATLPMHLRVNVGNARINVVHGDADSLAGWGFSEEVLATAAGYEAASLAFELADVEVFASSHSCLPVLQSFESGRALINNGAAGMPNFNGQLFGVATRIALTPGKDVLYRVQAGELFVEAVALRYDTTAWERRFLATWPSGTDAHVSYHRRIVAGPEYSRGQALRIGKPIQTKKQ